jgi:hypothetical protein
MQAIPVPNVTLVRAARTVAAERLSDLRGAASAGLGEQDVGRGMEVRGVHAPAAGLDAGDGDVNFRAGSDEQGEVQDAVLLCADQFLTVEEEDRPGAGVFKEEFGHRAAVVDLRHAGIAGGDGVLEQVVASAVRVGRGTEQGEDGQIAEMNRGGQFECGQFFFERLHQMSASNRTEQSESTAETIGGGRGISELRASGGGRRQRGWTFRQPAFPASSFLRILLTACLVTPSRDAAAVWLPPASSRARSTRRRLASSRKA